MSDPPSSSLLRRGAHVVAVSLRGAPTQFGWGIGAAVLFAGMTVLSSVVSAVSPTG